MLGTAGCSPLVTNLTHVSDEYLPSGGSRMNVILVIIDSLRKDHVGVYGNDWIKTPNLDALAKESLRFDRCLPRVAADHLRAARDPHGHQDLPFQELEAVQGRTSYLGAGSPSPRDQTTLAEILIKRRLLQPDRHGHAAPVQAFYDLHRGFHVFDFIRGQERDCFRPSRRPPRRRWRTPWSAARAPSTPRRSCASTGPTPWAARARRTGSPRRCSPWRPEFLETAKEAPALLPGRRQLRPARALGPAARSTSPSTTMATTAPSLYL